MENPSHNSKGRIEANTGDRAEEAGRANTVGSAGILLEHIEEDERRAIDPVIPSDRESDTVEYVSTGMAGPGAADESTALEGREII